MRDMSTLRHRFVVVLEATIVVQVNSVTLKKQDLVRMMRDNLQIIPSRSACLQYKLRSMAGSVQIPSIPPQSNLKCDVCDSNIS